MWPQIGTSIYLNAIRLSSESRSGSDSPWPSRDLGELAIIPNLTWRRKIGKHSCGVTGRQNPREHLRDSVRATPGARDPFNPEEKTKTMFHDLVGNDKLDLFNALLLLVDVLPLRKIIDTRSPFRENKRLIESGAIASRHWYKTACAWQSRLVFPASTQPGDWYLAVPDNSRSFRLTDQACD